jgi:3-oxoacyl-[acyl-carrier protein] reductase
MLTQPVALVTGGSRGIGRGICLSLARRGYAVAVNYAGNAAAAEETRTVLAPHGPTLLLQGDVSSEEDRQRLHRTLIHQWGRIDALINNAGITSQGRKDILEATQESWDRVLDVNLKGPFFLTQLIANEMIRLGPALTRPAIVNVTSLSAYTASTNRGDYCISKAGMSMLTQLYAVRLAEHGIRVFEVRPGVIDTDMTAGAREVYQRRIADGLTPIRRMGTPEDVGEMVALLLASETPYTTGDVINVDGGFHLRRL